MERSRRSIQQMWRMKNVEAIREYTSQVIYQKPKDIKVPDNVIPFPKPREE